MTLRSKLLPASVRVRRVRRNPARLALGRLAPGPLESSPRLDRYMPLPNPPVTLDWAAKLPAQLGMMLNDRIGNCTIAAAGHAIQVLTGNNGPMVTIPDGGILRAYEAVTGFDPYTGQHDTGAVEADVLAYWRSRGIGGHRIAAYGRIDHTDHERIRQTIDLFGFAYVGTQVPQVWQTAPPVWDVSATPIVGGHAVIYVGYDQASYELISWGRRFRITLRAHDTYVEETWGAVSHDWLAADRESPSGVDWDGLLHDLELVS